MSLQDDAQIKPKPEEEDIELPNVFEVSIYPFIDDRSYSVC